MLKELIPVTARGEATRRKLLAAAEAEFGSRGFHSASVSSITTEAGVGQGTFYLYFRSKEEVFATLVRDIGEGLRRRIVRAGGGGLEARDTQRRGLEAFLAFAIEYPGRYRIVQEAQFVDAVLFREWYEGLAEAYAEILGAAAIHGEDADARAWALLGIGHALALRYGLWQGRMPEPQVFDSAIRVVNESRLNLREARRA